jgi:hypothetical protein
LSHCSLTMLFLEANMPLLIFLAILLFSSIFSDKALQHWDTVFLIDIFRNPSYVIIVKFS